MAEGEGVLLMEPWVRELVGVGGLEAEFVVVLTCEVVKEGVTV